MSISGEQFSSCSFCILFYCFQVKVAPIKRVCITLFSTKHAFVTAQAGGAQYSYNMRHENLPVEYGLYEASNLQMFTEVSATLFR